MDNYSSSKSIDTDGNSPLSAIPIPPPSSSPSSAPSSSITSSLFPLSDSKNVEKQHSPPSSITSSSSSSSSSNEDNTSTSSSNNDQVTITDVKPAPSDWIADDRCPYYPVRSDGCTEPRSCRDCLNVDVGDKHKCMVNQYGRCVRKSQSTYVKTLDFECQEPSNDGKDRADQRVQFPAYKVDYCKSEDTKCNSCREKAFKDVMEGRIDGSLTKFCYGKQGCVCIAVCEAPIWKETIGQTVCNGTVVNKDHVSERANAHEVKNENGHGVGHVGNLIAGVLSGLVAVVILIAAVLYVRRRRTESAAANAAANAQGGNAAAGPSNLSLFGWQAMRSELIAREQLLLSGVEDFTNVRTGYLQLLDVDASAPPEEEDVSSAPVMLVPLAGASAPSFSPRGVAAIASTPSAPPSSPVSSSTSLEDEGV